MREVELVLWPCVALIASVAALSIIGGWIADAREAKRRRDIFNRKDKP